ncbi:hypothetical protein ACFFYR_10395 [Paraburkholderia dipogonis]|uniref:hypothetical protein n=1 Tax=Paraburkholderia dipogonis TaxID=1211383 RepID=UPI0035ED6041
MRHPLTTTTLAVGTGTLASSAHASALGGYSTATGANSLAVGSYSTAGAASAVAVGNGASATASNSVALGAARRRRRTVGSGLQPGHGYSVGHGLRRPTVKCRCSAGKGTSRDERGSRLAATDAVNVSQLQSEDAKVNTSTTT